jgi:polyribonucleotide nucleotidyltransferase
MKEAISENRKELSPNAPRLETLLIAKDKIRELIGPGGKMVKEICETTGVKIDIADDGLVSIFGTNKEKVAKALETVKAIGCMPEIGSVFEGTVVKIAEFGAFVAIAGGKEGLVHISNISNKRTERVSDALSVGQSVRVKIMDIDDRNRIKLSMRDV